MECCGARLSLRFSLLLQYVKIRSDHSLRWSTGNVCCTLPHYGSETKRNSTLACPDLTWSAFTRLVWLQTSVNQCTVAIPYHLLQDFAWPSWSTDCPFASTTRISHPVFSTFIKEASLHLFTLLPANTFTTASASLLSYHSIMLHQQ